MRRLPLALALAAAIVLTVTVTVHYSPPPTRSTVYAYYNIGGGTYFVVNVAYNTTLPPPVFVIASNGTTITQYDTTVVSKLGAVYYAASFNGTAVTYVLRQLPAGSGRDAVTITVATAAPATLWISTDYKTWAPVVYVGTRLA